MQVTITLNGKKIIDKGVIEGLTAIAADWDEGKPGPIILQGDHRAGGISQRGAYAAAMK